MYHIPKQNFQPHLKIDFSSQNDQPSLFSNPVYVEPVADSGSDKFESLMILCSRCQSEVIIAELKSRKSLVESPQPRTCDLDDVSSEAWFMETPTKGFFFYKLGPQSQDYKPFSARQRLDFEGLFYDEDYYVHNLGSSRSSTA